MLNRILKIISNFKDDSSLETIDNLKESNPENLISLISNDFLGYLKNKTVENKMVRVLQIYEYLFRFALEKIQSFSNNAYLMIITLQYLK